MIFSHSDAIWQQFPELAVGTIRVDGIVPDANVDEPIAARYPCQSTERSV